MTPLRELYEEFVREKTKNASQSELDCLLHPQDHPLVWPLNPCTCPKEETHCAAACRRVSRL